MLQQHRASIDFNIVFSLRPSEYVYKYIHNNQSWPPTTAVAVGSAAYNVLKRPVYMYDKYELRNDGYGAV